MTEYTGNTLQTVSCMGIIRRVDDALFIHRNSGLPEGGWVKRHPPYATDEMHRLPVGASRAISHEHATKARLGRPHQCRQDFTAARSCSGWLVMTEHRALSVGASLLAIKTTASQRASPAGTKRSPGSNKKPVVLAGPLQCALNLASHQTESRP